MKANICQSYLAHALDECSLLAAQYAEYTSATVVMWQDDSYLVVVSSDGFRMYEFRILLFNDDFAPATLLHERILSFSPDVCAAIARALAKSLWANEVMNIEYDDDRATITIVSPSGLSISIKANEASIKYDLREFSAKFAETQRPHTITLNAAQALKTLPRPRRSKERDLMHVKVESNCWRVGDVSGELCPIEQVHGNPQVTLTMHYLREALEVAEEYASDCIIEIPDTVDPVVVKFALGKALLFNAYIMPVREGR